MSVVIGVISGYVLVAREDWSPAHSHGATASIVLILVGTSIAILRQRAGHIATAASAAALVIPVLVIAYVYWSGVSALRLDNLLAQILITLLLVLALAVRVACFVFISDARRCHWCGFSLKGAASPKCPECGRRIEEGRRFKALVPRWRSALYESETTPLAQEPSQSQP